MFIHLHHLGPCYDVHSCAFQSVCCVCSVLFRQTQAAVVQEPSTALAGTLTTNEWTSLATESYMQ